MIARIAARFATQSVPVPSGQRFKLFLTRQDGTLTVFGLFILIMMLIVSGMAIDIVRHEQQRVRIQSTLDRAVLAASALSQKLPAETVVQDYIDKANLGSQVSVTIPPATVTNNQRRVSVKASKDMKPMFLNMVGIDSLAINANSTANQTATNLEVSMVLDISGSMSVPSSAGGTRISNLRDASEQFIDLLLVGAAVDTTTINIVPYAGDVNVGSHIFNSVGGQREHAHSTCVRVEESDFQHSGLPTASQKQVEHFTTYGFDRNIVDFGWCPTDDASVIVHSNNRSELVNRIRTMPMFDGTGTHIGMKWGLALLDPSSNALIRTMDGQNADYQGPVFVDPDITGGQTVNVTANAPLVANVFENRPEVWTDSETTKYILLMTDGQITRQAAPGNSGYVDTDTDILDNETDHDNVDGINYDYWNANVRISAAPDIVGLTGRNKNAKRFAQMCEFAKQNGVTVFTVAYEVPDGSVVAGEMKSCASTDSHYYNVEGIDIQKAFRSIAGQIYDLRLVN